MGTISRRNVLRGGAVAAAGAATLSFGDLFRYNRVFAQGGGDDPQTILDLAATAETFACTHYYNAIQSADALQLTDQEVGWLKTFLDAELKHKQFLEANGAKALATEFYVPATLFSDRATFVSTTDTAENWFIAAYLAATRRFAELGQPLLAATASQVSGVESEHQALIRVMGGLQPSNRVLKQPLFYNTSEVAPLFQPFLEGGDGFTGPAPFPGVDAISALVGDEGVLAVTPFTSLTNGMGTMASTAEAAASGACTVSGTNVNVRSAPNTSASKSGALTDGQSMPVTGQSMDANGITWYQIQTGWVRSDVVTVSGNCAAVPVVNP
jgi:hypothetical protein